MEKLILMPYQAASRSKLAGGTFFSPTLLLHDLLCKHGAWTLTPSIENEMCSSQNV